MTGTSGVCSPLAVLRRDDDLRGAAPQGVPGSVVHPDERELEISAPRVARWTA